MNSRSPSSQGRPSWLYRLAVLILLLAGLWVYRLQRARDHFDERIVTPPGDIRMLPWALGLTVLAIGLARRPLGATAARWIHAIRQPSRGARWATALLLGVGSAAFLLENARRQDARFDLRIHDENMYTVQAQMLAHGRLWMPEHPCADFFLSYHIFVRPVYAPMYFPGTALYYALPVRLGIPPWVFSAAISGLAVALVYLAITRLLDGLMGLAGVLMLLSISQFRAWGVAMMSHPLQMTLGLGMFLSALNWCDTRRTRWAALAGALAGWAIITRPLDALCGVGPLLLLLTWELRKESWKTRASTTLAIVLSAAPPLAILFIQNVGITGNIRTTAVHAYIDRYWPEMQMGWQPANGVLEPTPRPERTSEQFQRFYEHFVWPAAKQYYTIRTGDLLADRLHTALQHSLPSKMLLVVIPAGILALAQRRRWALALAGPLFFIAYLFFPFFLFHYVLVVVPSVIVLVLLGLRSIQHAAGRYGRWVEVFGLVLIGILSARCFGFFNGGKIDQFHRMPALREVNARLAALPPDQRAVVFFRFNADDPDSWLEEPVYNLDEAWPDDARIVRAHDLGERNRELIAYYARFQPDRQVYRYDMKTRTLHRLGSVKGLGN